MNDPVILLTIAILGVGYSVIQIIGHMGSVKSWEYEEVIKNIYGDLIKQQLDKKVNG